ncbi:hypothetical protein ACFPMF_15430 [Larkinella bovis]|uniref:Energy transducer TonB n=1 Tax=Larkinella bovis TaxID=683041 RepID=A0ABW0IB29_9BACT
MNNRKEGNDMLSEYTWGDFWLVVGSAVVIYYIVVGWVFYREDIRDFLTGSRASKETPSVATDPDVEEDDSDLFETVPYPSTSASAEVLTEAPAKPRKERKKREKKAAKKSVDQEPAPALDPAPAREPAPQEKEVDLPDTPVAGDVVEEGFLGDLVGVSIPLAEESVESIVEAAKDLDVHDDGTVTAKPEAGEAPQRLAKLASRRALPADLDNLPFNR